MNPSNSTNYKNRVKKTHLYAPIVLVLLYSTITIILYYLGPWDWPTKNVLSFSMLLIAYNFSLGLGFIIGIKTRLSSKKISKINMSTVKTVNIKYINIGIYLFLFFTILNSIRVTGLSSFLPIEYFNEVIKGLKDPSAQYYKNFEVSQGNLFGGSLLSYTNVLFSPLIWGVIPLSLFYFNRLKIVTKVVVIFSILLECSRWIAIGTNKGIFDIAISICTIFLIKSFLSSYNETKIKRKNNFSKTKIAIILLFPIYYFVGAISDRLGGNISNHDLVINNVHINSNSFLMQITPEFLETPLILISSYVTQGYYAMSMAITLPFSPMFGIGNSMFLMENFKELSGIDAFKYTYQTKLESFEWDAMVNWHTIYTWLANDVSFIGVIFVMFVMGYMYASVWKGVLFQQDPVAIVLMCLFSLIFIFMSSNNVVLSNPATFSAFWGLTFFWIYKKRISVNFAIKKG